MASNRLQLPVALLLLLTGPALFARGEPAPAHAAGCATGPTRSAGEIRGTPCDDVIVVPAGVATVDAGAGDDRIIPAPIAAADPFPGEEWLGIGSQTFEGGPGDDLIFGERGNDTLLGGEGNDRLYGGIGDDVLRGGPGQDHLAGGHGADSIDGEGGDDYVRGDGTIDRIHDTGGGTDTLSYSTGVTPSFGGDFSMDYPGFPPPGGERGVYLDLSREFEPEERPLNGNNGTASFGGGFDEVEPGSFERVIGTAFSDVIVGTADPQVIHGGGGADVLLGEGGGDSLFGGADGDHLDAGDGTGALNGGPGADTCEGGGTTSGCEGTGKGVAPRDTTKISVGFLVTPGTFARDQLYLVGSSGDDLVTATYDGTASPAKVIFEVDAGSGGEFDSSPSADGGCDPPTGSGPETVTCNLADPLDSLLLAGMGGNDRLHTAPGFPSTVSVMSLGGAGGDDLLGGDRTEDVLVDGDGTDSDQDVLEALDRDDALLHTSGPDTRLGGEGNDLFLSTSICDGDDLRGEAGRDNSSWARLNEAAHANLELAVAGRPGPGAAPDCGAEETDKLQTIEDLEGTSPQAADPGDVLYGDSGPNQLLGWRGPDSYFAAGGDDTILANSGDTDAVIDCGEGTDRALIDLAGMGYDDPAPLNCEIVQEAPINSFRFRTLLPPPPPPPVLSRPAVDRTPPRTRIKHRPKRLVTTRQRRRRVVFVLRSNERGAAFRCSIDRKPFRPCGPRRAYRLRPGKHLFRAYAIDRAGNRDRTPVRFAFRIRRR